MGTALTKIGITFTEIRLTTELGSDGATHYFAGAGYTIQTSQGETIQRQWRRELSGAPLTTVQNIFTAVMNLLKTQEGIP